jgi:hypothetical protein
VIDGFNHLQIITRPVPAPELPAQALVARLCSGPAIRLGTSDAQQAHDKVREAGVTLHNEELVRLEGVPAMFSFTDPDGNGLVYLEDADDSESR